MKFVSSKWSAAAVSCLVFVSLVRPADADDAPPDVVCSRGVCIVASGGGSSAAPKHSTCQWRGHPIDCASANGTFNASTGCYDRVEDPKLVTGPVREEFDRSGGSIVFASCPFGGAGGYVWVPPAKPAVTAELVRERALRLVPSAAVGLAPRAVTLVNIQTVMWVDAPPSRTLPVVQILGRRVVIHLDGPSVAWNFGDSGAAQGPVGKPYDNVGDPCRTRQCPDYYGHIYTASGFKTITARVHWAASFTVDGGTSIDIPGGVDGPPATAQIHVREVRSVLVPNP